jgi:hypothetical protein
MSSLKLLVNAIAGGGKTSLLATMDEETFVVSRDGKDFGLPLPHMLVDRYIDMTTLIYGNEKEEVEGIVQKIQKYEEHFGKLPKNVVFDSVSQITMDVIDVASQTPNVYGSQGSEITKELAMFTKFIHEDLELNGMNVILMNHVTEEKLEGKPTGVYLPFGQGKFLAKGAFYATSNEAITIVPEGSYRAVYLRGTDKQARTTCKDVATKMWLKDISPEGKDKKLKEGEQYFSLKEHMDMLEAKQTDVKKWSI